MELEIMNILHGITGSIAATTLCKFEMLFSKNKWEYKSIGTDNSTRFNHKQTSINLPLTDQAEWDEYYNHNKVLHIDLIKWADVFVIAPCTANTMAKLANGLCDNLLTSCARAWDFKKPFIIAPSMNVNMWTHPVTKTHISTLESWGIKIVNPIKKKLFCGDVGIGAMAHATDIVKCIQSNTNLTVPV